MTESRIQAGVTSTDLLGGLVTDSRVDSERRPLNRTKNKNRDTHPPKDAPSPLSSLASGNISITFKVAKVAMQQVSLQ